MVESDLYFYNTGKFSLITVDNDGNPKMINGVLSADKFFEFNNLINREVFYAKMPELFGRNVITPRTKRVETMYLECLYENKAKEKTELLYDVDPFNSPVSPEKTMLALMLSDMDSFIFNEIEMITK
jgi:adenine-specific DNA methylase